MTMTKMEVMAVTRRLMQNEGVNYIIGFNKDRSRLGVCRYSKRTIEFSERFLNVLPREEIVDTIRHEVAHAAVGPGHGNNGVWLAKYRALGGKGGRTVSLPKEVKAATSKYAIECSVSGEIIAYRQRKRAGGWRCTCHDKTVNCITLT